MKNLLLVIVLGFCSIQAFSQNNSLTFSAGYSFANIEEVDKDATGWRINGLYEFHPIVGKVVHGFSVGYINTSAEFTEFSGGQPINSKYTIGTLPFYYTPKLLIGEGTLQGFVKGALGMQFSSLKRTGTLAEVTSNDAGFYGGLGAGVMKTFNQKMIVNVEYEWAYLSNSYYSDGFMNSIMVGVGFYLN